VPIHLVSSRTLLVGDCLLSVSSHGLSSACTSLMSVYSNVLLVKDTSQIGLRPMLITSF
jgi:hypothetical protein